MTRVYELAELRATGAARRAGVELGAVPENWLEFGSHSPLEPAHFCPRCAERSDGASRDALGELYHAAWVIGVDVAGFDSFVEGRRGTRRRHHAGWRRWFRSLTGRS